MQEVLPSIGDLVVDFGDPKSRFVATIRPFDLTR